jgi:hypothetical protein
MKRDPRRLVALGLAGLLLVPAALPAGVRMGAEIGVLLQNGHEVWGELIAVKPDGLLVLGRNGLGRTVAMPEIATVRIVKRSKAWDGLLVGFLAGAIGGAVWGHEQSGEDMEELGTFMGGLMIGTAAGLVGLAAGAAAGADQEVRFRDLSEDKKAQVLAKLDHLARERGNYVRPGWGTAAGLPGGGSARASLYGPRFRLIWTPGFRLRRSSSVFSGGDGSLSFSFTEDLPPGEAGPYGASLHYYDAGRNFPTFSAARLALAYQWTPRIGAEVELHAGKDSIDHLAELRFASTIDGIVYYAYFGGLETTKATSLLAGLTFRPVPPGPLQPHIVEIGAAAGASWVRTSLAENYGFSEGTTIDRRTVWTARVRASYDFQFLRALSMGAFGEYRWLDAGIRSYTVTESLLFYGVQGYDAPSLTRTTEVTFPARTARLGGFVCGLRFSVGF